MLSFFCYNHITPLGLGLIGIGGSVMGLGLGLIGIGCSIMDLGLERLVLLIG